MTISNVPHRQRYLQLYKLKLPGTLKGPELKEFEDLEGKLSYEDLRFYRSIARAELRKDLQTRRKLEEEKKKQQAAHGGGGWLGGWWGSSSTANTEEILGVQMNDQKKKELFDALDYDEKASTTVAFEPPKDSLKARIKAKLQKGSLSLRSGPVQSATDVMSIVFEDLRLNAIQRPTSLDATVSLGDLHVYDGTTQNSKYSEIVRIKREDTPRASVVALTNIDGDGDNENALLMVKFEQSPLDERADNGLTVRLKSMEVVYHKGYVEAIYAFFKPPETQMESVAALLVCKSGHIIEKNADHSSRMSPVKPSRGSEMPLGLVWNMPYKPIKRSTSRWTYRLLLLSFRKSKIPPCHRLQLTVFLV